MIPRLYNFFFLLLLTFLIHSIHAQENRKFNIEGNRNFDDQFYIDIITNSDDPESVKVIRSLAEAMKNEGYYNFEVISYIIDTLELNDNLVYNLQVIEGPQTFIGNIFIDSLDVRESEEIIEDFSFLSGMVFIENEVETRINDLLKSLENRGYPFASMKINSVIFNNNDSGESIVDIYLEVKKDQLRRIDKLEIVGNTKTSKNVIVNAIRMNKGELYSQTRIEEIPSQLERLRFFENIEMPKYFINSRDEGILQISLKEKNTNTFDGILGYVPSRDDEESGYFTGFVNISLRNLFGTGRGAAIKWQQETSTTQELELNYFEPWIFNFPFNLNLNFFQRKQDSSFVKRIVGGSLEYLATENISASLLLESESVIPSINKKSPTTLNSTSINTGIQLKLDYRDNLVSPRKGTYFISTYKYRNKTINDEQGLSLPVAAGDIEYHNYEFDFGIFYSLFQNQVLALGVHAKELIGDYFDFGDFYQFGGTNSLRGYREKQFLGNRIIWSNIEYRFLLSNSSYVFAFFDTGYYLINENKTLEIDRRSDYLNGYGLGISLDTALGIMKISYAFAEGGSITNGLIHFGLVNDF